MDNKKSLYLDSTVNFHLILVTLALAVIGTTIYLTQHYFSVVYPDGLSAGSLCNINSFLNCDAATHSKLSNIMGVPISLFGFLISIFTLSNYLFKNRNFEGTLYYVLALNVVGCLILFIYSLIALGSLCPFCTIYYVLSTGLFLLFHFKSEERSFSLPALAAMGAVVLVAASGFYFYAKSQKTTQNQMSDALMKEFDSYVNLGTPKILSPHRLASVAPEFDKAPIQISVFSDFQCPACKALSEILEAVAKKYQAKANIQYYFYPLDSSCNSKMSQPLHPHACEAAYLAHCSGEKFASTHNEIFANQQSLDSAWLTNKAKEMGLSECVAKPETKKAVADLVEVGNGFNVHSTPTMLVNGVKIEGVLPLNQLEIILDELIRRAH